MENMRQTDGQTDKRTRANTFTFCFVGGKNYDNMLSRFHLIPASDGQTDRQTDGRTDRIAISISRVSMLTPDKSSSFSLICIFRSILLLNDARFVKLPLAIARAA